MCGNNVTFQKRGADIKSAISSRCDALGSRLEHRNKTLDDFMSDRTKMRSYLVLSSEARYDMHGGSGELRSQDDISSEEIDDINQLCRRIREIEAELYSLKLAASHIDNDAQFELTISELVSYGFRPSE